MISIKYVVYDNAKPKFLICCLRVGERYHELVKYFHRFEAMTNLHDHVNWPSFVRDASTTCSSTG